MRINSKWVKKNFKQNYAPLCNFSFFGVKKFAQEEKSSYIRRIEIKELEDGK